MVTQTPLNPAIEVITEGSATRYVLPPRQLDNPRGAAITLIAFGLITAALSCSWSIAAVGMLHHRGWVAFDILHVVFALFGLPGLVFSFVPLTIGAGLLFENHTEIIINGTHLIVREIAGPIRITFRRQLKDLRLLHVAFQARPGRETPPTTSTAGAKYCAIWAEGKFKRRMAVGAAYPRDLLIPLAQMLSERCALADSAQILATAQGTVPGPGVEIDPLPAVPPEEMMRVLPQPAKSRILLMEEGGMTSILIPRQGIRNPAAAFLLLFSILWSAITFFAILVTLTGMRGPKNPVGIQKNTLDFLLIEILFCGVGVTLFLCALYIFFRRAVFVASPDALIFTQSSIFGQKERQWPRAQIQAIVCGNSGTTVNGRALQQLQVQVNQGPMAGLLTGRDPEELRWLAGVLAQKCARENDAAV